MPLLPPRLPPAKEAVCDRVYVALGSQPWLPQSSWSFYGPIADEIDAGATIICEVTQDATPVDNGGFILSLRADGSLLVLIADMADSSLFQAQLEAWMDKVATRTMAPAWFEDLMDPNGEEGMVYQTLGASVSGSRVSIDLNTWAITRGLTRPTTVQPWPENIWP